MKKKQKTAVAKPRILELTHDTVPATVGLVKEVRDELRADIRSLDHKIDSIDHKIGALDHKFDSLDHKVQSLEHKIESMDHKIESMDHKIESMDHKIELVRSDLSARFELLRVDVHRTQVLMEEQRGENRIVLDGIKTLIERHDRLEMDVDSLRSTVKDFKPRA